TVALVIDVVQNEAVYPHRPESRECDLSDLPGLLRSGGQPRWRHREDQELTPAIGDALVQLHARTVANRRRLGPADVGSVHVQLPQLPNVISGKLRTVGLSGTQLRADYAIPNRRCVRRLRATRRGGYDQHWLQARSCS